MTSNAPTPITTTDLEALVERLAALEAYSRAREERIELLEEENRWLKGQLFGHSSEKSLREELHPDQARLFDEAEALSEGAVRASQTVTIPAHERGKSGRKKLSATLLDLTRFRGEV